VSAHLAPLGTEQDVILVAASGLAREVIAVAPRGIRIVGILDDDPAKHGTAVGGVPVLGGLPEAAARGEAKLAVCAGKGAARRGIVHRLAELGVRAADYATIVGPGVRVPRGTRIGAGSIVLPGVVITADIAIGRHVVLMPNVTLTHDDVLDDYATLAAGVALGGSVEVGEAAYLGMNAGVRERVRVGADAVVGMGAAVLRDVPRGETWVGVPARAIDADAATPAVAPDLALGAVR
jgi:sugar O-acyltransferase (sialic acid O-acetyltransferase NeuD family)